MDFLLVDGLIDVLKNEEELYRDILKASHEKTDIIVKGDIAELEKATREEQIKIFQLADLEDIREKIIAKLALQYGKKPFEMNVTMLKSLLPQDRAQKLEDTNIKLLKVLNEIKEVNNLNAKLIKNSLEYIDFSMNLLSGAELTGSTYGNSGQTGDVRKRNFFDVKL